MSAIELRGVAKQYPPREPGSLPQDLLRGVEPELGSSKPTQKDMQEFTVELKRMLQRG